MALVLKDRVQETTTTTGTGTITLAGAVTGYQSFSAIGNGNQTYYTIVSSTGAEWEVGLGTYTSSGTTLSRTTVLSSSNSGSLVNFSAGTKNVFCTYPSSRSVYVDTSTTITPGSTANLKVANGGTGQTSYSTGDMLYYNSGTSFNKLALGGSGTVLVSNGSAPTWSSLPSPTAAFTVASGSIIASGDAVALSSSGIANISTAAAGYTPSTTQFSASGSNGSVKVVTSLGNPIEFFLNSSNYPCMVAGNTFSGYVQFSGMSVVLDTTYQYSDIDVCAAADPYCCWVGATTSNSIVAGTFNSAGFYTGGWTIAPSNSVAPACAFDTANGVVHAFWYDFNFSQSYAQALVFGMGYYQTTGSTASAPGIAYNSYPLTAAYDATGGGVVCVSTSGGFPNNQRAWGTTYAPPSISAGASSITISPPTGSFMGAGWLTYSSALGGVSHVYSTDSGPNIFLTKITSSGGVPTVASQTLVSTNPSYSFGFCNAVVYNNSSGVVFYSFGAYGFGPILFAFKPLTISGGSVSLGSETIIMSSYGSGPYYFKVGSGYFSSATSYPYSFTYKDSGGSLYTYGITPGGTNATSFIGFATTSGGAGSTVQVTLPYNVATPNSGGPYTPGTSYYINGSGVVGTSGTVYIGKANTTTTIVLANAPGLSA